MMAPMSYPLSGAIPKRAVISAAASGDNTVVAAVPNKSIRVIDYSAISAGTVTTKWRSGSTDISGPMPLVANSQARTDNTATGVLETVPGQALVLNLSAAIAVGGHLTYVEV